MTLKRRLETIIIIYERDQVDAVEAYMETAPPDTRVISCNYWAEQELVSRGLSVLPLTDYVPAWSDFRQQNADVEDIARQWYRLPEMSFLQHKKLFIGEMIEATVAGYLLQIRGYIFILERIFDAHPDIKGIIIPHSTQRTSSTVGVLARFEVEAFASVAKYFASHRRVLCEIIETSHVEEAFFFPEQPFWKPIALRMYNALIGMIAPRHPLKIFVSDHWRNIKTIAEIMGDAELVFVDRKEFQQIPLLQLWKHRIRFMHPVDAMTSEIRSNAHNRQEEFKEKWGIGRTVMQSLPGFTTNNFNWWPVVAPAFDTIVTRYSERIIADIESIESIIKKEHITSTLVRASTSGQHHFFILGELPHQLGIPSVEIQHGIGVGTLDPHSAFGQIHADYVAAYGSFVQKAFMRNGYDKERIVPAGSPRFDRYFAERDALSTESRDRKIRSLGLDPKRPIALVVIPTEDTNHLLGSVDMNSYEFKDFIFSLKDIHSAIPDLQLILKFRSPQQLHAYSSFIDEHLPTQDIAKVSGDAFPFILASDFVYSPFSTLVSEAIMARKPVVLFPLKLADIHFFNSHEDGVLPMRLLDTGETIPVKEVADVTLRLINDKTFYKEAVQKGELFLKENFTFTGDAAKRVADFLRVATVPKNRN